MSDKEIVMIAICSIAFGCPFVTGSAAGEIPAGAAPGAGRAWFGPRGAVRPVSV